MAGQAVHLWTFSGLVGAFFDLYIVFLLLCTSTLVFLTLKFLSFFGFRLKCPCNGLCETPHTTGDFLQRLFLDFPSQRTSFVRSSVKTKLPFNLMGRNSPLNMEFVDEKSGEHEDSGSEGEVSCTALAAGGPEMAQVKQKSGAVDTPDLTEGRITLNGKRIARQKAKHGLRSRRKIAADNGRLSSYDPFQLTAETTHQVPVSFNGIENRSRIEVSRDQVNFGGDKESQMDFYLNRKNSQGFEWNGGVNENKSTMSKLFPEGLKFKSYVGTPECNANDTISVLEKALEEEHALRAELYVELEKERCAAATAADEAMAMILRLQEEKAAIEMDARQYQRVIEEKYCYDTEEMSILKEILLRREREKYFLEKEVEAYRQMIFANKHLDADIYSSIGAMKGETMNYSDDPVLMMQQISDFIDIKAMTAYSDDFFELPSPKLDEHDRIISNNGGISMRSSVERHHSQLSSSNEKAELELQEKELEIGGETSLDQESAGQRTNAALQPLNQSSAAASRNPQEKVIIRQESKCIPEVHVNDGESNEAKPVGRNKSEQLSTNLNNPKTGAGLPPTGSSRSKTVRSHLRRKSMSAFDAERLKIDGEINSLRERLRIVQEGREKLKEKGKTGSQNLEDMAMQLQESQQSSEPEMTARRASLPPLTSNVCASLRPLSSQVMTLCRRKRRWRSGPLVL